MNNINFHVDLNNSKGNSISCININNDKFPLSSFSFYNNYNINDYNKKLSSLEIFRNVNNINNAKTKTLKNPFENFNKHSTLHS